MMPRGRTAAAGTAAPDKDKASAIIRELGYAEEGVENIRKALSPFLSWQKEEGLTSLINLMNTKLDPGEEGGIELGDELISLLMDPDIVKAIDGSQIPEKEKRARKGILSACSLMSVTAYIVLRANEFEVRGVDVGSLSDSQGRRFSLSPGMGHVSVIARFGHVAFRQFDPALGEISEGFDLATAYRAGEYYLELRSETRKDLHRKIRLLSPEGLIANLHNNLGNAYLELDQLKDAAASYRKAIELNPQYAQAHSNLGNAYLKLGQSRNAITVCKKAIELDPGFGGAYNNLGLAYSALRQFKDAITVCKKAIELNPQFVVVSENS